MRWRAEAAQLEGTAKRRGGQDFVVWLGKDIIPSTSTILYARVQSSLSKKQCIEDNMASSRGEDEHEDVAAAEPSADQDAQEVEE